MEAQNKTGKESKSLLRQQPDSKTKTHYTFSKEVAGYKLVLLDDLGGGGFAKTYKAQYYDRSSNPDVPTKVVVKEFFMDYCERVDDDVRPHEYRLDEFQYYLEKFKRESNILSTISHKNIVKVLKQFDANNTSYYVMEFIDGLSFYDMIIEDKPVTLESARDLLLGVIDALEYMHHQKEPVYHMDITPNNIMFGKSDTSDGNESKLIDFGLCKTPDKGSDHVQFSTNRQARTEYFACPELYNPSDKYGNLITILPAMDVYSLAATLYFMVTGYYPLSAISDLNKSFHWPKNADLRAVHVLYPSMQLDINKRTASIEDFRRLLNEAITLDLPTKFEGRSSTNSTPFLEFHNELKTSTFTFPYGLEVSQLDDLLKQKCLRKKVMIKKTETADEDKLKDNEINPDPDKVKLITGNSDEQGVQQPSQLFTGVAGDPPVSEEHADIDEQNPKKAHNDRVEEKKPLVEGPANEKSQPLPKKPVDIPVVDKENDYNGNSWRARPKNSLLKEAERVKNNANNKNITIQVEKKNWINRIYDKFNTLFSKTVFLENAAIAVCICFAAVVGWYLSTVYDNNEKDPKAVENAQTTRNYQFVQIGLPSAQQLNSQSNTASKNYRNKSKNIQVSNYKDFVSKALKSAEGNNPDFNEARNLIKKAFEFADSKNDAQTWYVAGTIEDSQFGLEWKKEISGQRANEPVMYNALGNILPYFEKAYELDQIPDIKGNVTSKYTKDIKKILSSNHRCYINGAAYYFDQKDYKKAYDLFEQYLEISHLPMFKGEPTAARDSNYMIVKFYAAVAATQLGDSKTAIAALERAKKSNYRTNDVYQYLCYEYEQAKDIVNLERTLEEGMQKFPEEPYFLKSLINNYIYSNRNMKAIEYLNTAIAKEPNNPQLYDVMGRVYETGLKDYTKAEVYFKKALAINPEYIESLSNLGRLYYNQGINKQSEAKKIKEAKQYQVELVKAKNYFKQALPFFEKAHNLKPHVKDYMIALRGIYYNLNMKEKLAIMEAKLNK